MRPKARSLAAIAIASALALPLVTGCPPRRPPEPRGYLGPTETISEVVSAINANNRQLPSLWSEHSYDATLYDEQKRRRDVYGDGLLLYRAPQDLLLRGEAAGVGTVFELGSNAQQYWMRAPLPQIDQMWWGTYANFGKGCSRDIPMRPDLILEVLGVSAIDIDLLHPPMPTMRFNNDADAYMLTWHARAPDRWFTVKEVWYDRATKRPTLVLLFDMNGRVLVRAYLADHRPVEVPGAPRQVWPTVATSFRLYFPDSGTRMSFTLREPRLSFKNRPNDRTFRMPPPDTAGVATVTRLDEGCE